MWLVYANTYKHVKHGKITELNFYHDKTQKTNDNFIFLGYTYKRSLSFPISYPLILSNGVVIQASDYFRENS